MKKVVMYTDGSCLGNGTETAVGGYVAFLQCGGHDKIIRGYESHTTNNQMELRAVIEGVKALHEPCEIEIRTDSAYVCKAANDMKMFIKNGWKNKAGKEIANKQMWEELISVGNGDYIPKEKRNGRHHLTFVKVAGHGSDPYNQVADILAKATAKSYNM